MQRPVAQLKLVQSMLKIFVPPRANSVFGESELHTQHIVNVSQSRLIVMIRGNRTI